MPRAYTTFCTHPKYRYQYTKCYVFVQTGGLVRFLPCGYYPFDTYVMVHTARF